MSRLANLSSKEVVNSLKRFGYRLVRQKGGYIVLERQGSPTLVVPRHKEVSPHLIKTQLRRAGISIEDFLDNI